ncbi:hemerythrin domain-containing protein [Glycomyces halotolerans]
MQPSAGGSMQPSEESTNLISVIVNDHREVEAVFAELESRTLDPQTRKDLVDHVIAELVRHSVAEEQHMYPAVRDLLPDGDEEADHEIEEHTEAEEIMKRLEGLDPDDPDFERLLGELMEAVRHHVEEEETDLLPRLQEACSTDQLQMLGQKVLYAKAYAPTRPHPSAPDKPPANRILDPGAGLIDNIRDALSGRNV